MDDATRLWQWWRLLLNAFRPVFTRPGWVRFVQWVTGTPWTYLPHSSRLYFRKSQLPAGETFRKKTEFAPELLRQADAESNSPILGVFDGAYANETVIEPCVFADEGQRRIDIVTRLRFDARLYHRLVPNAKGRPRKWDRRMAAPQHHAKWKDVGWQQGEAFLYGRRQKFRYKRLHCRWHVSGPTEPVHVFVFEVEGYTEPWFIVTTALELSAEEALGVFFARFRQEDGFRDHKQRLGMQECRAWTKDPILRTYQVQLLAMTLLRLIQPQLDRAHGDGQWWLKPEWNRRTRHP